MPVVLLLSKFPPSKFFLLDEEKLCKHIFFLGGGDFHFRVFSPSFLNYDTSGVKNALGFLYVVNLSVCFRVDFVGRVKLNQRIFFQFISHIK